MIDEIYCINIKKRPDRLRKFKRDTEHLLETELGLKVQYTTDWDMNLNGEDITPEWLKNNNISAYDKWNMKEQQWYEEAEWGWWSRELTSGELGCAISHSEVWKRAKGYTLVLEDDVLLTRNWLLKLHNVFDTLNCIDKDWELLYLGRVAQSDLEKNNKTLIAPNIKKPDYTFCTYSYILSKKGLEKINKYKYRDNLIPSDEFLSATFVSHPRDDISLLYPPTINAYAAWPSITKQNGRLGSDTEDNGEKPRWKGRK
tara:strand:+ start:867 stop:1637 length:771 start_codon:yes stop_codon:yes gene_type:complete